MEGNGSFGRKWGIAGGYRVSRAIWGLVKKMGIRRRKWELAEMGVSRGK